MIDLDKQVIMTYMGMDYEDFIVCRWSIELDDGISGKEVVKVKDWANDTVALKRSARTWLKRVNPQEHPAKYELIISGRGADDRCRWCSSFRTALGTHMEKLHCSTRQCGACKF